MSTGQPGFGLSAIGTGHVTSVAPPGDAVSARLRVVRPLVELVAPFELDRQAIDDVERGALDSDWQPVKDAARQLAFAEDRAIFEGYAAGGIEGIREGNSNPPIVLPADAREYPEAFAQAISQLRLVGVNGPYRAVLSADAYTEVSETRDHGYPRAGAPPRLVADEDHLGASDHRGVRAEHARRRLRPPHRPGCVDWLHLALGRRRAPVSPGDDDIPATGRRGRRRLEPG